MDRHASRVIRNAALIVSVILYLQIGGSSFASESSLHRQIVCSSLFGKLKSFVLTSWSSSAGAIESAPLPAGVPYIALGLEGGLPGFSDAMKKTLRHQVVTHRQFVSAGLIGNIDHGQDEFIQDLSKVFDKVIANAPESRSILFNLDKLDLGNATNENARGFTLAEIRLIVNNPRYLRATRWFKRGKELSPAQIGRLFHPYFPDISP